MKMLYTPWREEYTETTPQGPQGQDKTPEDQCVFCTHIKENNDEKHFILKRYKHSYVILNRYPYNAGHILFLPFQHKALLSELSQDSRLELIENTSYVTALLRKELTCDGINVGINMGKAAGAGIPSH